MLSVSKTCPDEMIKEFAIEPRVMATWAHFQSLWEDFGVGRGRLISKYPVQWAQRVAELAKQLSPPVRATAIASKIYAEQHKFILRFRTYDGERNWLENALAHMAANPFDAIIAATNPAGHPAVLVAGEFDKGVAPFYAECQAKVERTAVALAQCALILLRDCEEIRLVDPDFDPAEPRFVETFRAVLALRDPAASPLKALEIHTERKPAFIRGNREHHLRRAFELEVPAGTTLRVCFWEQKPG